MAWFIQSKKMLASCLMAYLAVVVTNAMAVSRDGMRLWLPISGSVVESSTNAYAVTVTGGTLSSDRYGVTNGAYYFDGSNTSFVIANYSQPASGEITVGFWLKPSVTMDGGTSYKNMSSQYYGTHQMGYGTGSMRVEFYATGHVVSQYAKAMTLVSNTWYHIVVTGKAGGNATLYVNNTKYDLGAAPATIEGAVNTLRIGKVDNSFSGVLDEYVIYDRCLSDSQVSEWYTNDVANGMIAYYPFSGNANDASGNGNHGTATGATLTTDRNGQADSAYSFDGTNDEIASAGNVGISGATPRTVAFWMKAATYAAYNVDQSVVQWGSGLQGFTTVKVHPTQTIAFDGNYATVRFTPNTQITGAWHHVALVITSSLPSTFQCYIDGTLLSNKTTDYDNPISTVDSTLLLGGGASRPFKGALDEVRIYSWALNSNLIAALYASERSSAPSAPASVAASDGTYTNKVRVTWSAVSGASGYSVWRAGSDSSGSAALLGDSLSASYDDLTATTGQTYYYWVKATNSSGSSAFSSSDSGYRAASDSGSTPSTGAEPSAPSNVSATDGTYSNKVVVSWNAVTNATSYEVWRYTSNNAGSATRLNETVLTSFDDTNVTAGTVYYYWVTAKNNDGTSGFSSPNSGYTSSGSGPSGSGGSADLALYNLVLLPAALSVGDHPSVAAFILYDIGPESLALLNTRVTFDFYLSTDADFGNNDDLWIGDYSADVTLSAGSYTTVMLDDTALAGLTVPASASGTYYVFVSVRHASPSGLSDPTAGNDYTVRTGTVTVSGSGGSGRYHTVNDYDGDGLSDYAVYGEETGWWYIKQTTEGIAYGRFGGPGYAALSGDYDGDGEADPAVFDGSSGYWLAWLSQTPGLDYAVFSGTNLEAVTGDFNGDGKDDPGVYDATSGYWTWRASALTGVQSNRWFGAVGYDPVESDYDGDGKTDYALYHSHSGYWFVLPASASGLSYSYQAFGATGYDPAPGDYDGDGKTDYALYHAASGYWYILPSGTGEWYRQWHGGVGYTPVAGDYDGEGKTDFTVYHEPSGTWYVRLSTTGNVAIESFGALGYTPVE